MIIGNIRKVMVNAFLILSFSQSLNLSAQELVVKSIKQIPNSMAARSNPRLDGNNKPGALLQLQMTPVLDRVGGNYIGDPLRKGATETWVYMTDGSKEVKLYFKKHTPLFIRFADYGIESVKSNEVYEVRISENVPTNKVTFRVEPAAVRSTIIVNGVEYPTDQGVLTLELPYRSYEYEVKAEGYRPYKKSFFLDDGVHDYQVKLERVSTSNLSTPSNKESKPTSKSTSKEASAVFGLCAGLNMASAQFASDYSGGGSVMGFHAGLTADFRLSDSFWLATGLGYSTKGYKYSDTNIDEKANPAYVDVPLQLSWHLPLGDAATFQLSAGPYIGLCISGNVTDQKNDAYNEKFSTAYSGFDYGLQLGAGVVLSRHILIGASYQLGLASSYKNRCIGLSLGYRF